MKVKMTIFDLSFDYPAKAGFKKIDMQSFSFGAGALRGATALGKRPNRLDISELSLKLTLMPYTPIRPYILHPYLPYTLIPRAVKFCFTKSHPKKKYLMESFAQLKNSEMSIFSSD